MMTLETAGGSRVAVAIEARSGITTKLDSSTLDHKWQLTEQATKDLEAFDFIKTILIVISVRHTTDILEIPANVLVVNREAYVRHVGPSLAVRFGVFDHVPPSAAAAAPQPSIDVDEEDGKPPKKKGKREKHRRESMEMFNSSICEETPDRKREKPEEDEKPQSPPKAKRNERVTINNS